MHVLREVSFSPHDVRLNQTSEENWNFEFLFSSKMFSSIWDEKKIILVESSLDEVIYMKSDLWITWVILHSLKLFFGTRNSCLHHIVPKCKCTKVICILSMFWRWVHPATKATRYEASSLSWASVAINNCATDEDKQVLDPS